MIKGAAAGAADGMGINWGAAAIWAPPGGAEITGATTTPPPPPAPAPAPPLRFLFLFSIFKSNLYNSLLFIFDDDDDEKSDENGEDEDLPFLAARNALIELLFPVSMDE